MIIDCISDLHGDYPDLTDPGDLLIVAGDITAADRVGQWLQFFQWFCATPYRKRILVAGNHDCLLQKCASSKECEKMGLDASSDQYTYLCDSGCEFDSLRIWGSPWTKYFVGMNPHCAAFTCHNQITMSEKWDMIPKDTDILVTHCPPYGIMDKSQHAREQPANYGCNDLLKYVTEIKPKLHVFGHIHAGYGTTTNETILVNAAQMNEDYNPVNKPIRVIL